MKNIVSLILLVFMLLSISCKENEALQYENDPALYFVNAQYGQRDSIDHSFLLVPGSGPDTVYIEIHTMGRVSDTDRPFVLEQTNVGKPGAAVAGKHFVAFNDPAVSKYFVIPANSVMVRLPLILLRDKSLEKGQVRLELKIASNDYFHPGIAAWSNFVVRTTALATKPKLWDDTWVMAFGSTWGPVKMKFIIDMTGLTTWDIRPSDIGYLYYLRSKILDAFQRYNLENPDKPLEEEDRTPVTF